MRDRAAEKRAVYEHYRQERRARNPIRMSEIVSLFDPDVDIYRELIPGTVDKERWVVNKDGTIVKNTIRRTAMIDWATVKGYLVIDDTNPGNPGKGKQ